MPGAREVVLDLEAAVTAGGHDGTAVRGNERVRRRQVVAMTEHARTALLHPLAGLDLREVDAAGAGVEGGIDRAVGEVLGHARHVREDRIGLRPDGIVGQVRIRHAEAAVEGLERLALARIRSSRSDCTARPWAPRAVSSPKNALKSAALAPEAPGNRSSVVTDCVVPSAIHLQYTPVQRRQRIGITGGLTQRLPCPSLRGQVVAPDQCPRGPGQRDTEHCRDGAIGRRVGDPTPL